MAVPEARPNRLKPRIPFFTPVVASPLQRCWAINLSIGGIGITATAGGGPRPEIGDTLEVDFALGDATRMMRVTGRVAWTSPVRPDGRLDLGVEFREVAQQDRAELALFLANHRPRILVALPSPEEKELAQAALAHLYLDTVDSVEELNEELVRASASILVFSHDADQLTAFLAAVSRCRTSAGWFPGELPLAPILICTRVDSERLVPLLTDGMIHGVLRPPLDRQTLSRAVDRGCERWGMQVELGWASRQLESHARPRAPSKRNPELPPDDSTAVRVSPAMQRVYELIGTVAQHNVPVLLIGETGTGKELAARKLHALSRRSSTPFVAQDCGALTETLLESELFGHVRGAFTGATTDHPGLFQIADGGTIFLDEIQNTSPVLQAKLLRVVELGEVRPVGSSKVRRVDVRLIVACNVDLKQAMLEQRFRSDFYYRLNRFPIELPPLREHPEDILPLARFFLASSCNQLGRSLHRLDPQVDSALLAYDWPGNIRELKNAIERAVLLTADGEPIRPAALPDEVRGDGNAPAANGHGLDARVSELERRLIREALKRHGGVIRRAARDLQVNAITLSRKMRRLGLT